MFLFLLPLLPLLAAAATPPQDPSFVSPRASSLEAGFAQPPVDARPLVWWHWMDGNVTKSGIEADLADMKRVGIAGVQMFDAALHAPRGPVRYGSELWHEHVQFAIRTAARLGLEFHLMNTPGWSASAGPWVAPERSMKKLVWSETFVKSDGAAELDVALPQPETKLGFYRDVAVLAIPETRAAARSLASPAFKALLARQTKLAETNIRRSAIDAPPDQGRGVIPRASVVDLTPRVAASGRLACRLPAGEWTVLRFGFTSTGAKNHPAAPEGTGLEIDKLDADAVSFQFDQSLGRILREAGPLAGRTVKAVLFDSFEAGGQNWTESFPRRFVELRGYDLIPLLPLVAGRVLDSLCFTECVLHDFRVTIDSLLASEYFGTMRRRARELGLIVYAEAQGGPLNPMVIAPHTDVPMNEFWVQGYEAREPRMKLVASAADLLGRSIVGAEAFTAKPEDGRWLAVPSNLKGPGDYAWTAGINRFIFHNYTHQPAEHAPGFSLGRYGTHFGRLNSWWGFAGAWIDYLSRSQFLLQQGVRVADIGYLQNNDHGYAFPAAMLQPQPGNDYAIVYPEHLGALRWVDGALRHPAGAAFRLIVLPDNWAADIATLRRLRDFARAGAAISGPPPVAPAGLRDHEALDVFASLVAELWGNPAAGRDADSARPGGTAPLIRRHASVAEALRAHRIAPDVAWSRTPASGELRFAHRRTADADVYFVFNHSSEEILAETTFRVRDRRPELWDAVAGTRTDAPVFSVDARGISVPLRLEPFGSRFVVLRRALPERWIARTEPAFLPLAAPASPGAESARLLLPHGIDGATLHASDGSARRLVPSAPTPPPLVLEGPWEVSFLDGRGAPPAVRFDALRSWSQHADAGVRHYAGRAVYRASFPLPAGILRPDRVVMLDLGGVADIAEVRLNGSPLGVLWQPPFRADVTRLLRPGDNRLEIVVANRWVNRIIADEAIPVDYAYKTDGTIFTKGALLQAPPWLYDASRLAEKRRVSFTTWKHYSADSPLLPAGLLGPVRLEFAAAPAP